MKITVDSRKPADSPADLLAVIVAKITDPKKRLTPRLAAINRALGGGLSDVVTNGDFRGGSAQTLLLYPGSNSLRAKRVLFVGLGDEKENDLNALRVAAGTVSRQASAKKAPKVVLAVPSVKGISAEAMCQALAEGAVLAAYRFDRYREKPKEPERPVETLAISIERAGDLRSARAGARAGVILAESQNIARDLSNEPGNAMTPIALARAAQKVAKEVGLRVRVMDVPELKRRKMGAILAVGGGSANPPRMIVLEHNAPRGRKKTGKKPPTLCFVGKGITFDSGGISIKPSGGMEEMKHDMSGAAAVVGTLRACALLDIPHHVVGVIAAAENMPSGTAYRPGDVVTAMSGKTIEVLNTDAEGRVVLADALHYARKEYSPLAMVDLATLTGACMVALGKWATGLFSNDDDLTERLRRAGEESGERVWPLPLWEDHKKAIRSDVGDIKNTGGREAGASTAAAFLSNFVGNTPWVHLDIAGTGWSGKTSSYQKKGATGVGVRMLLQMLRGWEE